jgi:hypothetical protein
VTAFVGAVAFQSTSFHGFGGAAESVVRTAVGGGTVVVGTVGSVVVGSVEIGVVVVVGGVG